MPPDVTGNFSATGGVADMNCVLQVKLFGEGCEIVGVGVHLVAIPRLSGTAVPSPVMGNDSKATLAEKEHLSVPVVCGEWPAMAEDDGLAAAPVFVENLRSVFGGNRRHSFSPRC